MSSHGNGGAPLLEVQHLKMYFPIKSGLLIDRTIGHVHAVDDVSFSLADGEFVLAPSKRADDYYQTFNSRIAGGANVCFRFAGVGRYNTVPETIRAPFAAQPSSGRRVYLPRRGVRKPSNFQEIEAISVSKPTLEDVFIHRTGHKFWTEGT